MHRAFSCTGDKFNLQKLCYATRFLSRDPIQAGENWYIYCENDPTNSLDPLGLDRIIKIPIEGSSDKLPAHFYIEFDEPVEIPDPDNPNKKIKTRTIGFWPGNDQSNPFIPKPGQFKAPDDYQNRKDVKKIVVRESKDKQFNDDLRQVVREIVSKGRVYQLPKYTCMDFVTEAWDEARSRRGWVFPWQGD